MFGHDFDECITLLDTRPRILTNVLRFWTSDPKQEAGSVQGERRGTRRRGTRLWWRRDAATTWGTPGTPPNFAPDLVMTKS